MPQINVFKKKTKNLKGQCSDNPVICFIGLIYFAMYGHVTVFSIASLGVQWSVDISIFYPLYLGIQFILTSLLICFPCMGIIGRYYKTLVYE